MLTKHYLTVSKQLLLVFAICVFLVACDKDADDAKITEVEVIVPILSDDNIKEFTIGMAKNYNANLDSLMAEFYSAQKADNEYQFVNFRNYTWTPNYIKQKDFYQKVLENNASYLSRSPSRPLFDKFEQLIYIGIDLKNALLDKDEAKLQEHLVAINKDKDTVNSLTK